MRSSRFFSGLVNFGDLSDDKINLLVKLDPQTHKYQCALCKKKCSTKHKAVEHVRCQHVGRKDIKCFYCSDVFVTINRRNEHIYSSWGTTQIGQASSVLAKFIGLCSKPKLCEGFKCYLLKNFSVLNLVSFDLCFCLLQFFSWSLFTGPLSFKDLDDEKIKQLVKLNTDSGKPFCALCKKEFANKFKTFEHIKTIHIGRKDVCCLYCSEAFTTVTLRNLHIYKLHNEQHQLAKLIKSWLVHILSNGLFFLSLFSTPS